MSGGEFYMRQVVATGCGEELITRRLQLPEPALELLEWRKSVAIASAEAICGGVVVSGSLCSRCLVTVPEGPGENSGKVLWHRTDDPFTLHIPIPETDEGMQVTVTAAHVLADASRPLWEEGAVLLAGVLDQSLVYVAVRVILPVWRKAVHTARTPRSGKRPPGKEPAKRHPKAKSRKRSQSGAQTWISPSVDVQAIPRGGTIAP